MSLNIFPFDDDEKATEKATYVFMNLFSNIYECNFNYLCDDVIVVIICAFFIYFFHLDMVH